MVLRLSEAGDLSNKWKRNKKGDTGKTYQNALLICYCTSFPDKTHQDAALSTELRQLKPGTWDCQLSVPKSPWHSILIPCRHCSELHYREPRGLQGFSGCAQLGLTCTAALCPPSSWWVQACWGINLRLSGFFGGQETGWIIPAKEWCADLWCWEFLQTARAFLFPELPFRAKRT